MTKALRWLTPCTLAAALLDPLRAQGDPLDELRAELDQMRADYESRIRLLESRISELESRRATSPAPAAPVVQPEVSSPDPGNAARMAAVDRFRESFRDDTESREFRRSADAENPLDARLETVLSDFVDITGYFRAGYGRSDAGGPMRAFGLPGIAKYRLGNEAENYGELAFSKTFFQPDAFSIDHPAADPRGAVAQMNLRLSFYNPYAEYGSGSDTDFAVPELWASVANIIPGQPDARVWAGSRFYRRHDIHLNDFYFWDMSGGGAGIEDLEVGGGKLAFAWIGDGAESAIYTTVGQPDPLNSAGFSKSSFDLRYYDWNFLGGKGEVGLTYSTANSGRDSLGRQADDAHGLALSLVRTRTGFADPDSVHKTSLQVGTGPAKTFTAGFDTFSDATGTYIRPDPDESWRLRLTDQWVVKPLSCLAIGASGVWQYTDFGPGGSEQHWLSAGVRPIYFFNDWASLALEAGIDWLSRAPNGESGTLGKITLAPQISWGNEFFSRPVLRAFVTYAHWNDDQIGQVGGVDYLGSNDGFSWGVQMETWW